MQKQPNPPPTYERPPPPPTPPTPGKYMLPEAGCTCYDETVRRCPVHIEPDINYRPSFNNISCDVVEIAKQTHVAQYSDFMVIGVAKGGLVPAVILANFLKYPMRCVEYSSKAGKGDNKDHINFIPPIVNKRLLIIDDICDSGQTLDELARHLGATNQVKTAAIYTKQSSNFQPDFWVHKMIGEQEIPWVVFPWEF